MKTFKLADLAGQLLVFTGGLLYLVLANMPDQFIFLYYIVGAWQLCSFAVHLFLHHSWVARRDRNFYGKFLAWTGIILLLSALLQIVNLPVLLIMMFALLWVSPLLACWYFIIGLEEWRSIKRKELVHLK